MNRADDQDAGFRSQFDLVADAGQF